MSLKLTDISKELIDTTLVRSRNRAFISPGPFTEHSRRITVFFHNFRKNDTIGIIRVLAYDGIVGINSITHLATISPILFISSYFSVSGVLSGHYTSPGRSANRATRISLCKSHTLRSHTIYIRSLDIFLPITP